MKKILSLKKTDSIRQALELLKGQFGMIICILENEEVLSGVVSEGDLRRGVIKGYSLDSKLEDVMNKNPTYIYENELKTKKIHKSNIDLGATMDRPLIIPVVDVHKKLLYVLNTENLLEILQNKKSKSYSSEIKKPHVFGSWRSRLHWFNINFFSY